jgi:carbamoyl-phosphate synthase large subunit
VKKYNVLITGTSSYGVGEGLIKVVNKSRFRDNIKLIGASNSEMTAFKMLLDNYYILPNANSENYFIELNKIIEKESINIVIPGSEAEIIKIGEKIEKIEKIDKNTDVWINDIEVINTFNNKEKANSFFENNNILTPKEYKNKEKIERYPVLLKPICGKSSENIFIAENREQIEAVENYYEKYKQKYILQEYLPGEEYTVSLIDLGEYEEILIMKRKILKGATQWAKIEENSEIKLIIENINKLIKNKTIINIQIMKYENKYYIFEINPRFSGSSPMRELLGYNEFDIIFSKKYLNKRLEYKLNDKEIIRGYDEFIMVK